MSAITDAANEVYRDYVIPDDPQSGEHVPEKPEIRGLFAIIDTALGSLGVNGAITVKAATLDLLEADLAFVADTLAVVYNDPTPANNGIYAKTGSSGSGAWERTALALPSSFADDLAEVLTQLETVSEAVTASASAQAGAEIAAVEALARADAASAAQAGAETAAAGALDARDETLTAAAAAESASDAAQGFRDGAEAAAAAATTSSDTASAASAAAESASDAAQGFRDGAEAAAAAAITSADTASAASAAALAAEAAAGAAASDAEGQADTATAASTAAEAARDEALVYAELTGPFAYYATRADADTALPGLTDGQQVQVWADETRGGTRVVYEVLSAALEFRAELPTAAGLDEALAAPRGFALYGDTATRAIDTNLGGSPVPADIGQIFIGNTTPSADGITIDANIFPPGIALRRYHGTPEAPTVVTAGTQIGYTDYRGYSGTQFWNTASIDAIVDGAISFADGDLPPTKLRFCTASENSGAKVRMEVLASGRVEIGTSDSGTYFGPPDGVEPRFYVTTVANDWAMIAYAQPAAGPCYAARFHTLGTTASDYLLYGSSGSGVGGFRFSIRSNGDIYSATAYHVGTSRVVGARGAAVPELAVTAASGALPSATNALVIADATAPTNAELLKYCVELEASLETLLSRLRASTGHGLIA